MKGGGDPDNRRDFPGGWPGDARSAFEGAGRTPEEEEVFLHLRRLLHLRAGSQPLRRGKLIHLLVTDATYAYARVAPLEAAIVLIHGGSKQETIQVDVSPLDLREGTPLSDRLGAAPDIRVAGRKISVPLGPRSAAVYARPGLPR